MRKPKHWILTEGWVVLLELALVAALAIALARWTWIALAPRETGASAYVDETGNQRPGAIAQRHLFGASQAGMASGAGGAASSLRVKILGVFAHREPGTGRAIVAQENGRPATVNVGDAISPGVVLQEVHPDHVLVLRAGVVERINLERRTANLDARPDAPRPAPK